MWLFHRSRQVNNFPSKRKDASGASEKRKRTKETRQFDCKENGREHVNGCADGIFSRGGKTSEFRRIAQSF